MGHKGHIMVQEGLKMHEKKQKIAGILGPKTPFFLPFSYSFSSFWSVKWHFWYIFNLIYYKNIIFSLLRKKFRKSLTDFPLRGGGTPHFR